MGFICPRDKSKLYWTDYLKLGRWSCRSCQGTLVFEKNLSKFPHFNNWLNSLTALENSEILRCPVCINKMKVFEFRNESINILIDKCDSCRSYWLDPGELKLTTVNSKNSLQKKENDSSPYSAYLEYELQRKKMFDLYLVVFKLILIGFAIWVYFNTKNFSSEYQSVLYRQASSPSSAASVSIFFTLISLLPWKWCNIFLFLAIITLFQSVLIWVARF